MSELAAEEEPMGADAPGPLGEHVAGSVRQRLVREQPVSLRALLALSRIMAHSLEEQILPLALAAVARLTGCRPVAGYLRRDGQWVGWGLNAEPIPAATQAQPVAGSGGSARGVGWTGRPAALG
jgi:hypothetical protein